MSELNLGAQPGAYNDWSYDAYLTQLESHNLTKAPKECFKTPELGVWTVYTWWRASPVYINDTTTQSLKACSDGVVVKEDKCGYSSLYPSNGDTTNPKQIYSQVSQFYRCVDEIITVDSLGFAGQQVRLVQNPAIKSEKSGASGTGSMFRGAGGIMIGFLMLVPVFMAF